MSFFEANYCKIKDIIMKSKKKNRIYWLLNYGIAQVTDLYIKITKKFRYIICSFDKSLTTKSILYKGFMLYIN